MPDALMTTTDFEAKPSKTSTAIVYSPSVNVSEAWDDAEAERRFARHAEREQDRALSRQYAGLLEPFSKWHPQDQADLEYEVTRSPPATVAGPRKMLAPMTIDPFGSRQAQTGARADAFGVFDSMGRLRHDQVSTTGLSTADAASAYKRILCANAMGMALSTHVVIAWSLVGVHSDQGVHDGLRKVFAVLRDLNRRHLAHGRPTLAWVWTLERSKAKGLHSHVLVACDPSRRGVLLRAVARAIRDYTGRPAAEVTAKQVPVQTRASRRQKKPEYAIALTSPREKRDGSPSLPREMRAQWALWRYIFKGVQPTYWDGKYWMFRTLARSPQGRIQGQRWGYSTATLGDAAWRRYARSVGGDPDCVARFVDRLSAIDFPAGTDVYSPVWSA